MSEIRQELVATTGQFQGAVDLRPISSGGAKALMGTFSNKKDALPTSAGKWTLTATTGTDLTTAPYTALDVGNSIHCLITVEATTLNGAYLIGWALYDSANALIGFIEPKAFISSGYRRGAAGRYLCPTLVEDISSASKICPVCSTYAAGTDIIVYAMPL
jgi:hypothetical protein